MRSKERTYKRDLTYYFWHKLLPSECQGLETWDEPWEKKYLVYSGWHWELPEGCTVTDTLIDYCPKCNCPILLTRARRDSPSPYENLATMLRKCGPVSRLGKMANVPAFFILFQTDAENRVTGFRVYRLQPYSEGVMQMTPEEWADLVIDLQIAHKPQCLSTRKYGDLDEVGWKLKNNPVLFE